MQIDTPETKKHAGGEDPANAAAVFPPGGFGAGLQLSTVAALAEIPEEDIWLAKQKSKRRTDRSPQRHKFSSTRNATTQN
jgi:hypothetical protein